MKTSDTEFPSCSVTRGGTTPAQGTQSAERVGEHLVRSLAGKDAAALKALLQPGVDFRALTPGKFWESTDVDEIVDETVLGTWFGSERRITQILRLDTDRIGSLCRVGYRLQVERPDGQFVIEQQAYFKTDGQTISWLRVMCSGFLPLTS